MYDEKLARHTRRKKRIVTGVLAIVGFCAIAVTVFFTAYVGDCQIVGSQYGQEEQIEEELFSTPMEQRFFYQLFRSLTHTQKTVDGLASYQMTFSTNLSVSVHVTENPIIGAVKWEHNLYYFDRNGYVMAKDIEIATLVPVIDGSDLKNVALYEKLSGIKDSFSEDILQLTQLLADNEITADAISYDVNMNVTITLGEIKIALGSRNNMTDKIAELCAIIESGGLNGLKGTLHLENCGDGSTNSYIFDRE